MATEKSISVMGIDLPLALILLIVLMGALFYWFSAGGASWGVTFSQLDFQACKADWQRISQSRDLDLNKLDIDRDGCRDTIDHCVVDANTRKFVEANNIKIADATSNIRDLILLGNDYCDTDGDGVPDVCDIDPNDRKVGCDPVEGNEDKCQITAITVAGAQKNIAKCIDLVTVNRRK